jgi:acyl phosphate:glycerol-3-phosphate acyltransferase
VGRFALCLFLGYIVGSFPTAYLLVRWKSRIDIRSAGSGNVGTLNSYLVTNSKVVGIGVLLLDCAKGAGAVLLGGFVSGGDLLNASSAGAAAVAGHNYPVWLGFHGGKGLAPAAGAMALICWPVIPVWMLLWLAGYRLTRNVDPANAISTIVVILVASLLQSSATGYLGVNTGNGIIRGFVITVMTTILLRHIAPLRELVKERKRSMEMKRQ